MGLVGGGVGLIIFGIIILIAGLFINTYTQDDVTQCGEWYGQLGQMLDSQTSEGCQNASMMQASSQAGIFIGVIMAVIGIVCLGVGLSRNRTRTKSETESQPEPEVGIGKQKRDTEARSPIRSFAAVNVSKPEVGSDARLSDEPLTNVQKYSIAAVLIVVGAVVAILFIPVLIDTGTVETQEQEQEQDIDIVCDNWSTEIESKRAGLDGRQESIDQLNYEIDTYNAECGEYPTNYSGQFDDLVS
jgi:hypothetical protein